MENVNPRRLLRHCLLIALAFGASGCTDADGRIGGLTGVDSTRGLDVRLDAPLSSLGAWRYYDGVRLLECDLALTVSADGRSGESARWLEGVIDVYDLQTGRYLASDYLYPTDFEVLWGSSQLESGERRVSRPLRYTSYGPFRAWILLRYSVDGVAHQLEHRFDCH